MHVHVAVDNLDTAIGFYSTLFAAEPTVVKPDYAKWMLEDPRVNFAISRRGNKVGLNHLGIQVENEAELVEVYGRLKAADAPVRPGSRRGHARGQNERLYHLGRCDGVGRLHRAARGEAVAAGEKLIAVEQHLIGSSRRRKSPRLVLPPLPPRSVRDSASCGKSRRGGLVQHDWIK
ncbi:MAG: glyoxalase/bleomycin resistance/dioxygenase family protein [Hyphomicrobiaceae bacterium]